MVSDSRHRVAASVSADDADRHSKLLPDCPPSPWRTGSADLTARLTRPTRTTGGRTSPSPSGSMQSGSVRIPGSPSSGPDPDHKRWGFHYVSTGGATEPISPTDGQQQRPGVKHERQASSADYVQMATEGTLPEIQAAYNWDDQSPQNEDRRSSSSYSADREAEAAGQRSPSTSGLPSAPPRGRAENARPRRPFFSTGSPYIYQGQAPESPGASPRSLSRWSLSSSELEWDQGHGSGAQTEGPGSSQAGVKGDAQSRQSPGLVRRVRTFSSEALKRLKSHRPHHRRRTESSGVDEVDSL